MNDARIGEVRAVGGFTLAGYVALLGMTLIGLLPREGLQAVSAPARVHTLALIAVQGGWVTQLVALTYFLAQRSRRSTLAAMVALEHAQRGIRQRDALLHEANADPA